MTAATARGMTDWGEPPAHIRRRQRRHWKRRAVRWLWRAWYRFCRLMLEPMRIVIAVACVLGIIVVLWLMPDLAAQYAP